MMNEKETNDVANYKLAIIQVTKEIDRRITTISYHLYCLWLIFIILNAYVIGKIIFYDYLGCAPLSGAVFIFTIIADLIMAFFIKERRLQRFIYKQVNHIASKVMEGL